MVKQVIVVVHGVGIRAAGESADLIAAALDPDVARDAQLLDPAFEGAASSFPDSVSLKDPGNGSEGWRRRSSDDFRIMEPDAFGKPGLFPEYPARISRFRRFTGEQPVRKNTERVIADLYWGDVGGLVRSPPAIVLGLVRVMLGLVHVVRENALCVFPGDGSSANWARRLARATALAIHGPVFAINIVLFFGMLGVAVFGPGALGAIAVATVLSLVTATLLQLNSRTFLLRHLAAYTALFGLMLPLLAILDSWTITQGLLRNWLDPLALRGLCSWMDALDETACRDLHKGAYLYSLRLQSIMVALWFWISVMTLGFALHCFITGRRNKAMACRNLIAPSLALMSVLWFLVFGMGWALVEWTLRQIGMPVEIVATSQRGLLAVIAALAVVVVTAAVVTVRRWFRLRSLTSGDYLKLKNDDREKMRLIVAGPMRVALLVMPLCLIAIIVASLWSASHVCHTGPAALVCKGHGLTKTLIAYGVVVSTFLGGVLASILPRVIAVGGDVIMYINDIRWRRKPDDPDTTRTWAEAMFRLPIRPMQQGLDGYIFRQRLRGRLHRLVEDLIRTEKPTRIDIVCHSQGTVIAIDVLREFGRKWSETGREGRRTVTLTTMGSPYGHLFMTHFGHEFTDPDCNDAEVAPTNKTRQATRTTGAGGLQNAFHSWTNIFRIDDPIGTTIGSGTWHEEIALPRGGHANYWRDVRVSRILQQRLAFPDPVAPDRERGDATAGG